MNTDQEVKAGPEMSELPEITLEKGGNGSCDWPRCRRGSAVTYAAMKDVGGIELCDGHWEHFASMPQDKGQAELRKKLRLKAAPKKAKAPVVEKKAAPEKTPEEQSMDKTLDMVKAVLARVKNSGK